MLTTDLVRATRRAKELHVKPLSGATRERALELAQQYREIAGASIGEPREQLEQAFALVHSTPGEKKLALGLQKLIEDECEFETESVVEPQILRAAVFSKAAEAWRNAAVGAIHESPLQREQVLDGVGKELNLTREQVEQTLYADLRAAQRLTKASSKMPADVVAGYDVAAVQAVLLRAVRVRATVHCSGVDAYRALFRALKFHRLLYTLKALENGDYSIELDGPFSLFENVTKYGLQLALVLPALMRADHLQLQADVRWGKSRQELLFNWQHKRSGAEVAQEARLPDELLELVASFRALESGWKVQGANEMIDLPGIGLCVPDLTFTSPSGQAVHFELLGYWSRDAVWKRIEIARSRSDRRSSGSSSQPTPLLFAVSSRLRVSESVLKDDDHAALYVFKGVMNAKAVLRKLEQLTS